MIDHGDIELPTPEEVRENYTQRLQRPWILHVAGYREWSTAPIDNMPGYHQSIARLLSHAAVYCLLDWDGRRELALNYLQVAIDYHAMQKHTGLGRGVHNGPRANYFWPTTFAGIMLDDDDMRDLYKDGRYRWRDYHYGFLYFRQRVDDAEGFPLESPGGVTLGGETPWGRDTWTGYHARTGRRPVFYNTNTNVDELHPDAWPTSNTYHRMHSIGTAGFTLAMWAFDDIKLAGTNLDGDHAYAAYAVRWMHEDDDVIMDSLKNAEGARSDAYPPAHGPSSHAYATSGNRIVDELWAKYREDIQESLPENTR